MENYFEYYKIIFSGFTETTKTRISILFVLAIIGVCYFFINYNNMGNQLKILVFILTIGAVWLIYTNITDEKKVQSIILNHELAIGKIDRHIISSNGKSVNYGIEYSYLVDEKMIQHDYYENPFVNIPEKKPNLEIEYLVIYEKGNPKNSFILLNYPIKTNTDFDRYKELFKNKIPSDAINQN